MNKKSKLDEIANEIDKCKICRAGKSGRAVPGEGNPDADVVFIGEAPGKKEAETGRPFVGRSGKLLRSLIAEVGLKEDEIFITSPVKYLPDRGTPTPDEIAHGRTHLLKQLEIIQPIFVILLGRVAAEGVLENPTSPKGLRGARKVSVTKEQGSVIEEKNGIKYFLTYHPAAALRFPVKFKGLLKNDFQTIKTLL